MVQIASLIIPERKINYRKLIHQKHKESIMLLSEKKKKKEF